MPTWTRTTNNAPDFNSSPDGGASLDFDNPIDFNEHSQSYRDAATTNLFYTNNMIHDLAHHYGFDEASGNFQANNYGRGGTGGDYVRAEAADGNGTNNANFGTPVTDGGTPRMQMYLWPGTQFGVAEQRHHRRGRHLQRVVCAQHAGGPEGRDRRRVCLRRQRLHGATYPTPLPTGSWIAVVDGGTGRRRSARTWRACRSPRRPAPRRSWSPTTRAAALRRSPAR